MKYKSLLMGLTAAMLPLVTGYVHVHSRQPIHIAHGPATIRDQGDLLLEYEQPQTNTFDEVYDILTETRFYDDIVSELNDMLSFPTDVQVTFAECGVVNAFYDPGAVEITMCYELIKHYADDAHAAYQENYTDEVNYSGYFTFFHELGHALVD